MTIIRGVYGAGDKAEICASRDEWFECQTKQINSQEGGFKQDNSKHLRVNGLF